LPTAGDGKRCACPTILQVVNHFANTVERHGVGDVRSADAWSYNKPEFSTFEFLIELQRVENLLAREIFWQSRRQLEAFQKINNRIKLIRRQACLFS